MKKALIFDFDGLILDTEYCWYTVFTDWFKVNYQYDLTMSDFLLCVGHTDDLFLKYMADILDTTIDQNRFKAEVNEACLKRVQELPLMPGIQELLDHAKDSSIRCCIVSNASLDWILPPLERLGIADGFEFIMSAAQEGVFKPDPALYDRAVLKLGVEKPECLILEDSEAGLEAGYASGIDVILVTNRITAQMMFPKHYKKRLASLQGVSLSAVLS